MLNKYLAQGATFVMLMATAALTSSFRAHTGKDNPGGTYLHKISSPAGQTTVEYNADKTIRKIVQQRKTENAAYNDVQLPVYENGRLVKTLFADDAQAATGDLNAAFTYEGDRISSISYYRNNAVYACDSLVYNDAGKLAVRRQFTQNAAGLLVSSGYQQYTWDQEGNVTQMDNYGKQPGYSRFVVTSSISYTYDKRQNPQQLLPELAYILDPNPANMSAHNVLTESLSSPHSSRVITSTYTYAYNADKFPVRATFTSGLDAGTVKLEWVKL
ncbi:hypothetical protein [Chitinophaga solisilvae]|uniref:hypothetical protein n=1 Tax=Chitinophaga solisilvae TaxID=1233460 RepID=UPI00136DE17E|nr:hypothetical protein [Chitinophaga solisilvae]